MAINLISPQTFTSAVLIGDTGLQPNGPTDSDPRLTMVGTAPAAVPVSACLELQSIRGALLIPRMSEPQRDALAPGVAAGMMIYNTDTDAFNFYGPMGWFTVSGGAGSGDVTGPGVSIENNIVTWDNTNGTAIKDSTISITAIALAPDSATGGNLINFGGSPNTLEDSGLAADLVVLTASLNASQEGHIATFSGTSGALIQDSGTLITDLVTSTSNAATVGDIAVYSNIDGRQIQDSGINISTVGVPPRVRTFLNLPFTDGLQLTGLEILNFEDGFGNIDVNDGTTTYGVMNVFTQIDAYGGSLQRSVVISDNNDGGVPTTWNAVLELDTQQGALLVPRLNSIQVAALPTLDSVVDGMVLYDTTADAFSFHQGGNWVQYELAGGSGGIPGREQGTGANISLYFGTGYNTTAIGARNIGIGDGSLPGLISGDDNIWVGCGIPPSDVSGSLNGSNNIIISSAPIFSPGIAMTGCGLWGSDILMAGTCNNRYVIGNGTTNGTDNSLVIGGLFNGGSTLNVGIGTQNPKAALHVIGGQIVRQNIITANGGTYNVTSQDYAIGVTRVDNTSQVINLPALSDSTVGQVYYIGDVNGVTSGANNFIRIIANSGADPINGVYGPGFGGTGFIITSGYIWFSCMRTTAGYVILGVGYVSGTGATTVNIRDVTTDTVVIPTDYVINVVDTSATRTITLPPAALAGETFVIKDGSGAASVNNITVQPSTMPAGQLIDGQASVVIDNDYGSITLVSDGSNYYII